VRFWFNPDWNGGTGTGAPGYWFELGDVYSPGGGWALESDSFGTGLSFVSGSNGVLTTYLTAPIGGWVSGQWHQVVLSYSASQTLLFLDGAPAASGPGLAFEPDLGTRLADGFTVGSDPSGWGQAGGVFDELATFNCPMTQAEVTTNYPYPAILAQPQSQTVNLGGTVTFSVSACGTGTLTYQWRFNGNNISGATATNYSISSVQATNAGTYSVVVANGAESAASSGATLTVNLPFLITSQPLSQEVIACDNVTMTVAATGNSQLSYQWYLNGTLIPSTVNPSAASASLTIQNVQTSQGGSYSVQVSCAGSSYIASSATAVLTVDTDNGFGSWFASGQGYVGFGYCSYYIGLTGQRQDYTFKSDVTYYIDSTVQLFGTTTIEGGAVIKFYPNANSCLQVPGTLVCKTSPYRPAILTSSDDVSLGDSFYGSGSPQTANNGAIYLDLSAAGDSSLSNLRICFADTGVAAPASGRLDVWNCQFYQCNGAVTAGTGSLVSLHNVLVSSNVTAIVVSPTCAEIDAEQLTADVTTFYSATTPPGSINLTNSIVLGTMGSGSSMTMQNVAINPSGTIFQAGNDGQYYLAANSPYHAAGTANISSALSQQLQQKTTSPPFALPPNIALNCNFNLCPQVKRYSGGAPDYGYYYDALDYTVAGIELASGSITVEPGTAIAVCNELVGDYATGFYTCAGFLLDDGTSFISHGTPTMPITFTATKCVQETPSGYWQWALWQQGGSPVSSIYTFQLNSAVFDTAPAPVLDCRFCDFYLPIEDCHICYGDYYYSSSSVALNLQDCAVHGGQILMLHFDYGWFAVCYPFGTVTLANSLFDHVNMVLEPTDYDYWGDGYLDVVMSLQAYNNLFLGDWMAPLCIYPTPPAAAGNWTFWDNLFDSVAFQQASGMPLDCANNAYWPLQGIEPNVGDLATLSPTTSGDQTLAAAPPYQSGPFGNYYLPTTTPLHQAGSVTGDSAGLCQYTTRLDQTKEQIGQTIDIGLHYVAAGANNMPMDTDGDGVPDYVEDSSGTGATGAAAVALGETDYTVAMTDGVTPDSLSTVYANVDLAGDGLPGAMAQWLGTNPLLRDNPFVFPPAAGPLCVSGVVQFDLNFSQNVDTNAMSMTFTVDGTTMNSEIYDANGQWIAEWDSTEVTNGVHELSFELQPTGADPSTVVGSTIVLVQNAISFLNFIPFAGSALYIQPQTIYPNGTWAMNVYDDQGNLFTSLQGQIDGNGLCDDPVTSQPGISVSILDNEGNQLPSTYYTMELTTYSAEGGGDGNPSGGGSPSATATKAQSAERPWDYPGEWIVTYMPPYAPDSVNEDNVELMINSVMDPIAATPIFSPDGIINSPPIAGGGNQLYPLNSPASWTALRTYMSSFTARNLYFFGHFDGQNLGGTKNPSWSISMNDLQTQILLNGPLAPGANNKPPFNLHPYRFVFIDGCSGGASCDLPLCFGIPKVQTTTQNMQVNLGLLPRAFVGWKGSVTRTFGSFNTQHGLYIKQFFSLWQSGNDPRTGAPYTLLRALEDADLNQETKQSQSSLHDSIQVWGSTNLLFSQ
jgi:hypothetical protein